MKKLSLNLFSKKGTSILLKKIALFLPLILTGAVLANFIFIRPAQSTGPQFNYMPNDPKTLRVANSSQRTDWQAQVQAKQGETISFLFYYHNGVEGTVAKNTRLRVDIPKNAQTSFKINGYLWADNTAQIVSDSVIVKTDKKVILNYIPGSTKWYPNGTQTATNLPDGIVSAKGINIGNIKGCWPYAGYVIFQVRLNTPPKPKLALTKKVANSSRDRGTYNWQKEVSAKKGEEVAFSLFVYNPGNTLLKKILVKDSLPQGLTYIPNSTKLFDGKKQTSLPDGIIAGGITLKTLPAGIENGVYITFKTKVNTNTQGSLTNRAVATAQNLRAADEAHINILLPQITKAELSKTVRNISRKEIKFNKSTVASPGEEVEFRLIVKNTGNQNLTNVLLKDNLPKELTALSNLSWHWDSIASGKRKVVYIKAKVKNLPVGKYYLVNEALLSAARIRDIKDQAEVRVNITPPTPVVANYTLDKKVKNISKGDGLWLENNTSYAGDTFEYKIYLKNTGSKTETITLTDDLPLVVGYINNSGKLLINGKEKTFSTDLFSNKGLKFTLSPGQEGMVYFRVKVAENLSVGSKFVNCAYLKSPSMLLKDCVTTTIKPKPQVKAEMQELPPTGNALSIPFSLFFALFNYAWYRRFKSQLS